ncbi:NAD(P)-dependent oxidoreductase [Verrucomicrobiales bacterium]|jgi:3-hydroxyisobutyrate dehydrogenase-like beta-hydroxyacid dehydrogenase|nr:NAD(P)-dependent oxidoreductase [Verrucomicrobiales bacterium]MDA7926767.1 NAD(P)-dependent oxidoreductase [Verrucomicrobiales bacterium]|tara:strand:+ start:1071 stop:1928 length:858 start_codon:yes stop_codon:yes gene_type:complete
MQTEGLEKVGLIGLGIIGSRVAESLKEAGKQVYVWSRTPKPVANFLSSPQEVAGLADIIQIFTPDETALLEVVQNMLPALGKRHVIINHSTSDPEAVVEAYQLVRDTGAAFLDCPFTGSRDAAEKGALVYYAGGDPKVLDRVRPTLEISAKEIVYLGRVGEASVIKIATNMISAATMEIIAEAYGMIEAAGIDPARLQEAINHNGCRSPLIETKLASIIKADYEPHFTLKNLFKDIQYALKIGKSLKVEQPALTTTANVVFKTIKSGKGDQDFSVLAERFQDRSS